MWYKLLQLVFTLKCRAFLNKDENPTTDRAA